MHNGNWPSSEYKSLRSYHCQCFWNQMVHFLKTVVSRFILSPCTMQQSHIRRFQASIRTMQKYKSRVGTDKVNHDISFSHNCFY